MPMTQISTPSIQGPSTQTLDFLRQFARTYKPQRHVGKYIITHWNEGKNLGEC